MNPDYSIRELTEEEFTPLFDQHKTSVFEDVHSYDLRDILSSAELEHMEGLGQCLGDRYKLHLGVFDKDDQFVGWSWGSQENASTFYMVNSGVLKEHRRKGLYRALLGRCIEVLSKKGFQLIYSRHCATNNDVIIPKLQAGFIIAKMEMDDKYGVLIHLHFYTNNDRRRIMDYRAGQLRPDDKIKKVFKV
jgi:ribosomal protein S18 acetylase RimI-like enzyme